MQSLRELAVLEPPRPDDHLVDVTVGPDGAAVALRGGEFVVRSSAPVPGLDRRHRLVARGPRLHVFDGARWSVLDL